METRVLADILTPDVVTFLPDTPLASVLDAMAHQRISCVLAVDAQHHPLGILTERDVLALFSATAPLLTARLADAMTAPVFALPATIDYREAYYQMSERQLRHLVVVNEAGGLAGIVTEADFLHHLGEEYLVEVKTVAAAMDRNVCCLNETDTLDEALALMQAHGSDHVVVLRAGGRVPVGILTERDVVRLAYSAQDRAIPLGALMTPAIHAIPPDAPLQTASQRMRQLAVRRLLVISERQGVVGVITRHDIVKSLQGGYVEYLRETLTRLRREMREPELPLVDFHRHLLLGGVLDLIEDGVYMVAADGRFLDANERGCKALGYTRTELRHLWLWDVAAAITGPEDWVAFCTQLSPSGATIESQHRRKDDTRFPVRVRVYASRGAGQPVFIGVASDRSEELALAESIRESERFYRHVIDSTVDGFFRVDTERRFIEVNDRLCELFGYAREEWLGRTPPEFVTEESRAELLAQLQRMETAEHRRYQLMARRKDGSTCPILLNTTTHRNLHGEVVGAFGFITDLTPIVAAQQAVAASEKELRSILDNMQDTYYRTDLAGRIVRVSPSIRQLLGYAVDAVIGRKMTDFYFDPAERTRFLAALEEGDGKINAHETHLRHRDGHDVWVLTNAHYVRDAAGKIVGVEGTTRDISDQRLAKARISFLAHHDPLTELPNRLLFKDRCEQAMAHAQRAGTRMAILFVDLDRFKAVNDSFGHTAGDTLLRDAARRLQACVRETDTVSRQGGDEFLIALTDLRDDEVAALIAGKVLAALAQPFMIDGRTAAISASIGIALYPSDGLDFEALLRKSDVAMYHAKDAGRNACRFYNERMESRRPIEL